MKVANELINSKNNITCYDLVNGIMNEQRDMLFEYIEKDKLVNTNHFDYMGIFSMPKNADKYSIGKYYSIRFGDDLYLCLGKGIIKRSKVFRYGDIFMYTNYTITPSMLDYNIHNYYKSKVNFRIGSTKCPLTPSEYFDTIDISEDLVKNVVNNFYNEIIIMGDLATEIYNKYTGKFDINRDSIL